MSKIYLQEKLTAGSHITIDGTTISSDAVTTDATQSASGLMSSADKTKLDSYTTGKQNAPSYANLTLSTSGWSSGVYSLENTYSSTAYDIEVFPDGDSMTSDQYDAWTAAKPSGSTTANKIIAKGDVPTADIPIIVKVVKK